MPDAPSGPWSDAENDLTVADYMAMLRADIARSDYSKAEHNRRLVAATGRPRGAIEFKHQNISAVLLGLGQPWIPGYKPAANFQATLIDAVLRWLDQRNDWLVPGGDSGRLTQVADRRPLWIGPPPTLRNSPSPFDLQGIAPHLGKLNAAGRDALNRALGRAGEELVVEHERTTLATAGRPDLAQRVRWISEEDGDGAGYDIASFDANGGDRLIEVKTTNGWERTPFHISRNECAAAEVYRDRWSLVRLYDFAREPRAFAIHPPLERHVELMPTSFLASLL